MWGEGRRWEGRRGERRCCRGWLGWRMKDRREGFGERLKGVGWSVLCDIMYICSFWSLVSVNSSLCLLFYRAYKLSPTECRWREQ